MRAPRFAPTLLLLPPQLCTLLANQRGLVANSYMLRVTLLTHLFLRVLPMPLPRHRADRRRSCFWGGADAVISHDTQARAPPLRRLTRPAESPG